MYRHAVQNKSMIFEGNSTKTGKHEICKKWSFCFSYLQLNAGVGYLSGHKIFLFAIQFYITLFQGFPFFLPC